MKYLLLWVLCVCIYTLSAQYPYDNKRDYIWRFGIGYYNIPNDTLLGHNYFDFRTLPMQPVGKKDAFNFDNEVALICDSAGEEQFFCNGKFIYNREFAPMIGSDTLPNGDFGEPYAYGQNVPQGALILPMPGHEGIYYVFTQSIYYYTSPQPTTVYGVQSDAYNIYYGDVYVNIVNMNIHPMGIVTDVNLKVIADTVAIGALTACRHGNGRDWWIIASIVNSNRYYRLLLTPTGLLNLGEIAMGEVIYQGFAAACFSPDGSKFARVDGITFQLPGYIVVQDFDRCTGILSNNRLMTCPLTPSGVSFSPSSRYMYVSASDKMLQYDLWSSDWEGSAQVVMDTETTWPYSNIAWSRLAPDGKLYVQTDNSVNYMYIIHAPDSMGAACNPQYYYALPCNHSGGIPNYPYFRLGAEPGSVCDSLGIGYSPVSIHAPIQAGLLRLYPNPSSKELTLSLATGIKGRVVILDAQGREVWYQVYDRGAALEKLSVEDLPEGVYILRYLPAIQEQTPTSQTFHVRR